MPGFRNPDQVRFTCQGLPARPRRWSSRRCLGRCAPTGPRSPAFFFPASGRSPWPLTHYRAPLLMECRRRGWSGRKETICPGPWWLRSAPRLVGTMVSPECLAAGHVAARQLPCDANYRRRDLFPQTSPPHCHGAASRRSRFSGIVRGMRHIIPGVRPRPLLPLAFGNSDVKHNLKAPFGSMPRNDPYFDCCILSTVGQGFPRIGGSTLWDQSPWKIASEVGWVLFIGAPPPRYAPNQFHRPRPPVGRIVARSGG